MKTPLLAAGFCGVLLACAALPAPAFAAGGGAPKVRVVSDQAIQENEVATLDVRYRCATGTTATLFVSLRQGGTAQNPVSLFDTSSTRFATVPPLTCDGDKHVVHLALIAVGSTDDDEDGDYAFLTDTANGGGRAFVRATLTDASTGVPDSDVDRVDVTGR